MDSQLKWYDQVLSIHSFITWYFQLFWPQSFKLEQAMRDVSTKQGQSCKSKDFQSEIDA